MRHRDVHVGDFFLAEKEGGREFTADDEEILVLFASQAATAIANARAHRDERRARADLEALVETSPVGVVVFDGGTGRPASLNREARRLVDGLNAPGRPPEELLEALTCRFSDGREVALAELPMKQVISDAATVRAEEVVLSVPDGRRVTLLVNATPIHAADGAAESMVVTLQDLASLRELERLQAEFLSMVSHELRAPLTSIKGSTATVLRASRVLDPAEVRQFFRVIDVQADHMDGLIGDLLDAGRIDSGTLSVDPFVSGGGRQAVRIDLPPELPRVMADERRIVQVLNNLFSNASRHSPETSPIHVGAVRDGVHVAISVSDEGRGVPPEELPYLFRKYADVGGGDGTRGLAGFGLGLGHLQGAGGGSRGAHPGRERRTRTGHPVHLHGPGGGRARRHAGAVARPVAPVGQQPRGDAHRGGGRRPRDAAPRAGRAHRGGLHAGRDRRPGGARRPREDAPAGAGPAGPAATGHGRHRADGAGPRAGRPAGHLHLRLRTGRDHREDAGGGGGRLAGPRTGRQLEAVK